MTKMVTWITTTTPRLGLREEHSAPRRSWLFSAPTRRASPAKGEFARREGIYSSQLTEWRRARDAGTLIAREPGAARRDQREFDKLEKKNKKLEAELEHTRLALDIVGKAHALLEKLSESA